MNGSWFPWSEGVNGNGPGEYVAAWRRVHDIFTAVGATNATWVWCPYGDAETRAGADAPLYPGGALRRLDLPRRLQLGRERDQPAALAQLRRDLRASYERSRRRSRRDKPMMLAETASNGNGGAKAAWIRGMFEADRHQISGGSAASIWFNQFDRDVRLADRDLGRQRPRRSPEESGKHPYRGNRFGAIAASPIPPPR